MVDFCLIDDDDDDDDDGDDDGDDDEESKSKAVSDERNIEAVFLPHLTSESSGNLRIWLVSVHS